MPFSDWLRYLYTKRIVTNIAVCHCKKKNAAAASLRFQGACEEDLDQYLNDW